MKETYESDNFLVCIVWAEETDESEVTVNGELMSYEEALELGQLLVEKLTGETA